MWGFCEFWCLYKVVRSFQRVLLLCMLQQIAMAAQDRRNRTMDGQCLECLVNEFEERPHSEPARFRGSACTICLGPLLTPVVVVERETWETLFHAAAFHELGRDFKISNASKLVKVVGSPPDLLSNCIRDVAMTNTGGKVSSHFLGPRVSLHAVLRPW
jgi:hypothetical protein